MIEFLSLVLLVVGVVLTSNEASSPIGLSNTCLSLFDFGIFFISSLSESYFLLWRSRLSLVGRSPSRIISAIYGLNISDSVSVSLILLLFTSSESSSF